MSSRGAAATGFAAGELRVSLPEPARSRPYETLIARRVTAYRAMASAPPSIARGPQGRDGGGGPLTTASASGTV